MQNGGWYQAETECLVELEDNMKIEIIQSLTNDFEAHAQTTVDGVEFWLARELQYLLGYEEWRLVEQKKKSRILCSLDTQLTLLHRMVILRKSKLHLLKLILPFKLEN